jgi:hypothetical protein
MIRKKTVLKKINEVYCVIPQTEASDIYIYIYINNNIIDSVNNIPLVPILATPALIGVA